MSINFTSLIDSALASTTFKSCDLTNLYTQFQRKHSVVIDVRSTGTFKISHVIHSINISFNKNENDVDFDRLRTTIEKNCKSIINSKYSSPKSKLLFITNNKWNTIDLKNADDKNVNVQLFNFIKQICYIFHRIIFSSGLDTVSIVNVPFNEILQQYPYLCFISNNKSLNDNKKQLQKQNINVGKRSTDKHNYKQIDKSINKGQTQNESINKHGKNGAETKTCTNDEKDSDSKVNDDNYTGMNKHAELKKYKDEEKSILISPSENDNIDVVINQGMKTYPSQILFDCLYLGDLTHAQDINILKNLKITHIVNCTKFENYFEKINENNDIKENIKDSNSSNSSTRNSSQSIKYYKIELDDDPKDAHVMKQHFNKVIEFIDNALSLKSNRVLVHCHAGISRSSTVVIAYLMKTKQMTFNDAEKFVHSKRPQIRPNMAFKQKLKEFEQQLLKNNQTFKNDFAKSNNNQQS